MSLFLPTEEKELPHDGRVETAKTGMWGNIVDRVFCVLPDPCQEEERKPLEKQKLVDKEMAEFRADMRKLKRIAVAQADEGRLENAKTATNRPSKLGCRMLKKMMRNVLRKPCWL